MLGTCGRSNLTWFSNCSHTVVCISVSHANSSSSKQFHAAPTSWVCLRLTSGWSWNCSSTTHVFLSLQQPQNLQAQLKRDFPSSYKNETTLTKPLIWIKWYHWNIALWSPARGIFPSLLCLWIRPAPSSQCREACWANRVWPSPIAAMEMSTIYIPRQVYHPDFYFWEQEMVVAKCTNHLLSAALLHPLCVYKSRVAQLPVELEAKSQPRFLVC